jgi:serine/threonine protein kinase
MRDGVPVAVKLARAFVDSGRAKSACEAMKQELHVLRALAAALSSPPPPPHAGRRPVSDGNHVPRLLGNGEVPRPFLVLEPLGTPLPLLWAQQEGERRHVAGEGAEHDALHVAREVLRALRFAHAAGWTHNDVRPSNVVAVQHSRAAAHGIKGYRFVLVDWGLAAPCRSAVPGLLGHPLFACDAALRCAAAERAQAPAAAAATWRSRPAADVECVAYLAATLARGTSTCAPPWAAQLGDVALAAAGAGAAAHVVPEQVLLHTRGAWFDSLEAGNAGVAWAPALLRRDAIAAASAEDEDDAAMDAALRVTGARSAVVVSSSVAAAAAADSLYTMATFST